jgi:CBS domain-containing protein
VLPVVGKVEVVGIVKAEDLVSEIRKIPELRNLSAGDVGTLRPLTVREDASISQAISLMKQKSISHLPVVGKENNVAGIVSLVDLMRQYLLSPVYRGGGWQSAIGTRSKVRNVKGFEPRKKDVLDITIKNAVTDNVVTADTADSLLKIVQLMKKNDITNVVLTSAGKLAGIITLRDLLRAILSLNIERRNIQFINLPELDEIDRATFENALTESYDKLEKILHNSIELSLHVKTHQDTGLRKKYSVHCRLNSPGINIVANSTRKWKFLVSAQDALKTLEKETLKRLSKPRWKQP